MGFVARARRPLAVGTFFLVLVLVTIVRREGRASSLRATRASIGDVVRATSEYRAANGGNCPPTLEDLVRSGYLLEVPLDGWERPLRLVCPGRKDPKGFDVVSDGPDGEPFGLDRVEN